MRETNNLDVPDRGKVKRVLYTNVVVIGEFRVAEMRKIVVTVVVFDGKKLIHLHEWYFRKKDETWNPSSKGISIPTRLPFKDVQNPVQACLILIANIMKRLDTIPLDDPANYVYAKTREERHQDRKEHIKLLEARIAKKQAQIDKREANQAAHRAKQEARKKKIEAERYADKRLETVRVEQTDMVEMCDVGFVSSILDDIFGGM